MRSGTVTSIFCFSPSFVARNGRSRARVSYREASDKSDDEEADDRGGGGGGDDGDEDGDDDDQCEDDRQKARDDEPESDAYVDDASSAASGSPARSIRTKRGRGSPTQSPSPTKVSWRSG